MRQITGYIEPIVGEHTPQHPITIKLCITKRQERIFKGLTRADILDKFLVDWQFPSSYSIENITSTKHYKYRYKYVNDVLVYVVVHATNKNYEYYYSWDVINGTWSTLA